MKNWYLYLLVFVCGAAVLAIEILGTRILAPYYGMSLFSWSALITVSLTALSAGYVLGGRWADRNANLLRLCVVIASAGVWLLLIPLLKRPILALTEPLGLRAAVLLAALTLFAPPLTLLGMVSPYAIKLKTASLSHVGRTAGDFCAISTIAGVISALLTGFFLLPALGVSMLTLSIGLLLIITSAVGLWQQKASRVKSLAAAGIVLFGVVVVQSGAIESPAGEGLVAVRQSPYAELRVIDTEVGRHLLIDGRIHAIVDTAFFKPQISYIAVMEIVQYLFGQPGDLLLIGLNGGSLVRSFEREGWRIEVAEIDAEVTEVAYKYFGLSASAATIHHTNGRQYLSTNRKTYDAILLDAFGSGSIPFHLVTQEAFRLMAQRLKPNGILAINIETVGWHHILTRSLTATLKQNFAEVLALPMAEPPDQLGNMILLASNRKLDLVRELERNFSDPDYRHSQSYHRNHAWDNQFVADIRRAPILTDDLNPVDVWSEATNLRAREEQYRYFRKDD